MIQYDTLRKISFNLLLILIFFMISGNILAQSVKLSGVVKDSSSDEAIPGASVVEEGTTNGTMTDMNGSFMIELTDSSASIQVSYIGYETIIIPVNNQTNIEILLNLDAVSVDEVVVVGYGTQKKKVVTGSISSVSSEEISSSSSLRADQVMQGRTAGVMVVNQSGQPGENPTIRIRGVGTTGNSDPLYVVDGLPVGNIDFLNPSDIESIDVLKDAASAAIYGARAANGVVLITTKSGKKGKTSLTYSGYYGIQNVSKKIDMLNAQQYMELMNEGARNGNQTEPFDINEIPLYDTDWQDELFQKNVPMMKHELNINGGTESSVYSASMSYFSQQGIIGGDKSRFERYTGRINTTNKVNKWLRFGTSMIYSHIISQGISSNTSFNGAYSSAMNIDPLTPVYQEDQNILNTYPYSDEPVVTNSSGQVYGISENIGAEIVNPLALLEIQTGRTRVDRVVGNAFGELEIIEGLKFKSSLGVDYHYTLVDSYKPLYFLNGAQLNVDKTSVSKDIYRNYTWQNENTLNYSKSIGKHNFSILAGNSISKFNYENLSGFNTEVSITQPYLDMATDTLDQSGGGANHTAWLSYFGRVLYDYKSKYAFTGIIRRDGSTIFGPDKRYGIFPSVGVSWAVSDEGFFPQIREIEYIKLRASWGINGNDKIGAWQYLSLMDYSRSYIFGGGRIIGASPQFMENPEIHWEESNQIDIAIDVSAFKGRLSGTIDYYIKTTNGLLEVAPIPAHVGNSAPVANIGSVQNKGIELSVNWQHSKKDFSYSLGINGSYNKNEMIEIANEEGILAGANWAVAGMVTRSEEGLPLPYFFGYETDGIFQSETEIFQHIGSTGEVLQPQAVPGDVKFVDVNNDGIISPDDRTIIGNPIPDFTFGMHGSFVYKQFDFSFLLSGTYGNEIFNGSQRNDLKFTNRTASALDRWTEENPSNEVPRYTWSDVNNNNRVSDLYIEDGSYLRVKNIQIGYNIPAKILNKINSTNWRFYISAENLYTLTKYTGADPEIGGIYNNDEGTSSVFDFGIDRGIYPQARIFRFGTTLTF